MKCDLPDRLVQDIVKFAQKNEIEKVVLFGSRARGTNLERSDVDLAVSGGSAFDFYEDLEEYAHTLLFFDVVNLDRNINAELQHEIERDGITLYEKRDYFGVDLANLREGLKREDPYSVVEQMGIATLFQYCFDHACRAMRKTLDRRGLVKDKIVTRRATVKLAYQFGVIDDLERWLAMLDARNLVVGMEDVNAASDVVRLVKSDYINALVEFKAKIDKR